MVSVQDSCLCIIRVLITKPWSFLKLFEVLLSPRRKLLDFGKLKFKVIMSLKIKLIICPKMNMLLETLHIN